ncbi:MAG: hypothetical protein K6B65_00675 [Bacilli bacterium]|nr:hypothetical protein [Bacilli bacterium]
MKTRPKLLSPKRIDNREKIIAYINAFFSLATVVCGLIILSLVNEASKIPEADQGVVYVGISVLGAICMMVTFIVSGIMELVAASFRHRKRVLYESVPFAICYFLLAVIPITVPDYPILGLCISMSIFVLLNFSKLVYTHITRSKDKGSITWVATLVLLVLTGSAFIVMLFLLRDYPLDLWTAIALYLVSSGFFLIFYSFFRKWSPKKLVKVMRKSHAAETLFGLAFMVVAVAISLSFLEPSMESVLDALWYCFACVTTIGFGDIVATTIVGRILSVFLGIYGILVTAVITSIIVNLYNESRAEEEASKAAYLAQKQALEEEEALRQEEERNEEAKRAALELMYKDEEEPTSEEKEEKDIPVEKDIRDENE